MKGSKSSESASATTCLFTGELLNAQTKLEHTIQQSVGGRIKSRDVSCDAFNEAAGNGCDTQLAEAYSAIFNRLGPMMPSAHKTPKVPAQIYGAQGQFQFEEGGILRRVGLHIAERDTSGKPTVVHASTFDALRRYQRTHRLDPAKWKISVVPGAPDNEASFVTGTINRNIEIAALKAILLTFDHLLDDRDARFTRSTKISPVREMVRRHIMEGKLDINDYDRTVLGLQYNKLDEIHRLRKMVSVPVTPFEHLMIACGNTAARTLDVMWHVAGIDPFGFRLSRDWTEGAFTYVLISGVVAGSSTSKHLLPMEFNCKPEPRWRAKEFDAVNTVPMVEAIGHYRLDAWQRVVDLIERRCPGHVRHCVIQEAWLGLQEGNGGLIKDALVRCLMLLFLLHRPLFI